MVRRTLTLLGTLCLLSVGNGGEPAGGHPQDSGVPTTTELPNPPAEPTTEATATEEDKRQKEIEKLEAEIENLRLQNDALGVRTRRWSVWLGAIGGVTGAMLTFVIGWLGLRLNRLQVSRVKQEEHLSLRKLEQDRHLEREKQNMELYKGLGHENPRVQFAAASVLLERLNTYREKTQRREDLTEAERAEHPTIILVLVAVIKERIEETETHRALRKHIADNLVKALRAVVAQDQRPPEDPSSPLQPYDWQYANLAEVWWEGVDARGVDFYQANFHKAGLARAFLNNAVFYEADVRDAVLKGAHLEGANFFGAEMAGARMDGATFGADTVWPEGFDPDKANLRRCGR